MASQHFPLGQGGSRQAPSGPGRETMGDRNGGDYNTHAPRQGTEGPGGVAQFYHDNSSYVDQQDTSRSNGTSLRRGDSIIGTGTDGFGAGTQSFAPNPAASSTTLASEPPAYDDMASQWASSSKQHLGMQSHAPPRSTSIRRLPPTGFVSEPVQRPREQQRQQPYATAAYQQNDGFARRQTSDVEAQTPYSNGGVPFSTYHQYPPLSHTYSTGNGFSTKEGALGVYFDRAPDYDKLNDEQKEIADSFPKDLDEDGGSMMKNLKRKMFDWRSWLKWKYTHYYIIIVALCALLALMTIYHHQIIDWLTPISKKARSLAWGWVIPVVILFIISFPPLFGHEVVGVLCGVVYGLWIGFGILSLGTLLGELGNFIAFRFFLLKHAAKAERKSLDYACMAHIVREGGFLVILLARLSAIPGHFTTAVFATVGMNIFIFTIAAVLSLPKQLVVVYLGVAIEASGDGTESTSSKIIKYAVLFVSTLVTILVALFLYHKMQKARPTVQKRLREERYRLLIKAATPVTHDDAASAFESDGESVGAGTKLESSDLGARPYYAQGDLNVRSTDRLASPTEERHGIFIPEPAKRKKRGIWSRVAGRKKADAVPGAQGMNMTRSGTAVTLANGVRASFETDSLAHDQDATSRARSNTTRPQQIPYMRQQGSMPQDIQMREHRPNNGPYRQGPGPAFDALHVQRPLQPAVIDEPAAENRPHFEVTAYSPEHGTHFGAGLRTEPWRDFEPVQPAPASHAQSQQQTQGQPTSPGRYRHVPQVGSIYDFDSEAAAARRSGQALNDSHKHRQSYGMWREPSVE